MSTPSRYSRLIAFPSNFGWVGLIVESGKLSRLTFGLASQSELGDRFQCDSSVPAASEKKWVELLERYLAGENVDLSPIPLCLDGMTPFQERVLSQCRQIPFGATVTYGHLAAKSGSPKAARAVGSVMAKNRIPLVIPCHRVLPASGVGQYSAGSGVETKKKLLRLEGAFENDLFGAAD